mmetsp:Transcript_102094/g.288317  ORF Transcript_102094/g.288317 Transcript_102094/m.288317 type:complete len:186 (+) Transcript_102094:148-705(+)
MGQTACCCCAPMEQDTDLPNVDLPKVKVGKRGAQVNILVGADGSMKVSGEGAVLADTVIEQDAAYWEVRVDEPGSACRVGVARDLNGMWLDSQIGEGEFSWALDKPLNKGDIVGVAFGQDDMPNLRFFVNGTPIEDASVKKVQGDVYPAVSMRGNAELSFMFEPELFKHQPTTRHTEIRPPRKML